VKPGYSGPHFQDSSLSCTPSHGDMRNERNEETVDQPPMLTPCQLQIDPSIILRLTDVSLFNRLISQDIMTIGKTSFLKFMNYLGC
jgi:hypothetical protein